MSTQKKWTVPLFFLGTLLIVWISAFGGKALAASSYNLVQNVMNMSNRAGTWEKDENGYRYKLTTGQYLKGRWAKIDDKIYCFDASGYRRKGFYLYRNRKYYLKSNGQLAVSQWLVSGTRRCYLKEDGTLATGFVKIGSSYYYFNARGIMVRGWNKINGRYYYFRSDGTRAKGWELIKDPATGKTSRYYFSYLGIPRKGLQTLSGKTYYLSSLGKVTTGWVTVNGERYYFGSTGAGVSGWKKISNSWYYFDNGHMLTSQWIDGYYLQDDGKRQSASVTTASTTGYIFCGDSRTVLMSRAVSDSQTKYVAKSGQGYYYLSGTGYTLLKKYLKKNPRVKVILNFGVNDLSNFDKYIAFYQKLITEYPSTEFYIMSVNPLEDSPTLASHGKTTAKVLAFNAKLKAAFPGRYIDSYSYLMKKGFKTIDGCHYTSATSRVIYKYAVSQAKLS